MRRLSLSLAAASTLLLTACGSVSTRFDVSFKNADEVRQQYLQEAMIRVIDARLQSQKKTLKDHNFETQDEKNVLTLSVSDKAAAETLTQQLSTPFTFRIMQEVPAGQGDIHSEKHGDFAETGVTEKDVDWVEVKESSPDGPGAVVIRFTEEGRARLRQVFTQTNGKVIGIFVRDQLMSKKQVDATDTQDSIAIDNIPSSQIASIFADDVNVGIHVVFTPLP